MKSVHYFLHKSIFMQIMREIMNFLHNFYFFSEIFEFLQNKYAKSVDIGTLA